MKSRKGISLTLLLLIIPLVSVFGISSSLDSADAGSGLATLAGGHRVLVDGDIALLRHGIPVSTTYEFNRNFADFEGSANYRIGYQIVDGEDNPVPLEVQDAAGNQIDLSSSGDFYNTDSFNISLTAPQTTQRSNTVYLVSASPLDQREAYSVKVRLQKYSAIGSFWSTAQTDTADADSLYAAFGFASRINCKAFIEGLSVHRTWIIDGLQESYEADVTVGYYRYDPGSLDFAVTSDFGLTLTAPDASDVPLTFIDGTGSQTSGDLAPTNGTDPSYEQVVHRLRFTVQPSTASGRMPSTEGAFDLLVERSHDDAASGAIIDTLESTAESLASPLLHLSGQLNFGAIETTLTAVTSGPNSVGIVFNGATAEATFSGFEGSVDATGHTYGPDMIAIRLLDTGVAEAIGAGSYLTTAPANPDADILENVSFRRKDVRLSSTGAKADIITVKLPRGLGWTDSFADGNRMLDAWLDVSFGSPVALDENLQPLSNGYELKSAGNFYVCEESKPFMFEVSEINWDATDGKLSWAAVDLVPIHRENWERLEEAVSDATDAGVPTAEAEEWLTRESNLQLFRFAKHDAGSPVVLCNVGLAGDAQLDFSFELEASSTREAPFNGTPSILRPHNPSSAEIYWDGNGNASVVGDAIASGTLSGFLSPGISLTYDLSAPGLTCGFAGTRVFLGDPVGNSLRLTKDGGYLGDVDFAAGSALDLGWGLTEDENSNVKPVHSVVGWTNACLSFMAGGSFLAGAETWELPASSNGIGFVAVEASLASGFAINGTTTLAERPHTPEYLVGSADYPGFNFRVAPVAGSIGGVSHVGGVRLPQTVPTQYKLKPNSKYYVGGGGVSGVHDVDSTSLDAEDLIIYGYPFSFGYFGLAYIDSSNDSYDSTMTGRVTFGALPLADGVDFKLDFDVMSLSDGGQLKSGDLVLGPNPKRDIAYWNGSILPRTFSFEPGVDECANVRFLTLGIEAYGALIDQPMHGRVALHSMTSGGTFGDFFTYAEAQAQPSPMNGANGRLRLPGLVRFRGPASATETGEYELYNLRTIGEAYFNSYNVANRPDTGFISFPASMDVAFFRDLRVHVRTPATNEVGGDGGSGRSRLSGGWGTLWDDVVTFDADHTGFDASTSATDYWSRNYDDVTHRVGAGQELFGLIGLDYPLEWQPALGYFTSPKQSSGFLILETHHTIDYLSPERVEVSFGASADTSGLPSLNFGNIGVNALANTGIFDAVSDAAQQGVARSLHRGEAALGELIEAYPEQLFDEMFEAHLEFALVGEAGDGQISVFENIIALAVGGRTIRGDGAAAFQSPIDDAVSEARVGLETALGAVDGVQTTIEDAGNLINEIDRRLMEAQNAIRAIIGVAVQLGDGETILRFRDGEVDLGGVTIDWDELAELALENDAIRQEIEGGGATLVQGLLPPAETEGQEIVNEVFSRLVARMIVLAAEDALSGIDIPSSYLDFGSVSSDILPDIEVDFGPTLTSIRLNLLEIDRTISEVRQVFDTVQQGTEGANGFLDEIEAYGQDLNALLDAIESDFEAELTAQLVLWEGVGSLAELDTVAGRAEFSLFVKAQLREMVLGSEFFQNVQLSLRQRVQDLGAGIRTQIDAVFAQAESAMKKQLVGLIPEIDLGIQGDFLSPFNEVCAYGEIEGHLTVIGDRAELLRLDALFEMDAPEPMRFEGFLEIKALHSTGAGGCNYDGVDATEMTIGAIDIPVDWISDGLRMNVATKFAFDDSGPRGFGGSFDRTAGVINFEAFTITDLGAAAAFGRDENYLAASTSLQLQDYALAGGVFFGRTCSVEPIAVAHEQTAETLYDDAGGSFSGALCYGYAAIPISEALGVPSSCMFRISAGVGSGIFYFAEGPTFGGIMDADVSGEALCVVGISGAISMVGSKVGDDFRFNGSGRIGGRAGKCPFCVRFGKTVRINYQNSQWDVSY